MAKKTRIKRRKYTPEQILAQKNRKAKHLLELEEKSKLEAQRKAKRKKKRRLAGIGVIIAGIFFIILYVLFNRQSFSPALVFFIAYIFILIAILIAFPELRYKRNGSRRVGQLWWEDE